jgi:hypothetical protein
MQGVKLAVRVDHSRVGMQCACDLRQRITRRGNLEPSLIRAMWVNSAEVTHWPGSAHTQAQQPPSPAGVSPVRVRAGLDELQE